MKNYSETTHWAYESVGEGSAREQVRWSEGADMGL